MTPGSNLFSEWQAAESFCGASSQLRKIFWNIQDYLWIILPFAVGYIIACATMTLWAKNKGKKKRQMSNSLFIIFLIGIGIVALFISKVFHDMFGHIPPH
jgi:hypothetical protein